MLDHKHWQKWKKHPLIAANGKAVPKVLLTIRSLSLSFRVEIFFS